MFRAVDASMAGGALKASVIREATDGKNNSIRTCMPVLAVLQLYATLRRTFAPAYNPSHTVDGSSVAIEQLNDTLSVEICSAQTQYSQARVPSETSLLDSTGAVAFVSRQMAMHSHGKLHEI